MLKLAVVAVFSLLLAGPAHVAAAAADLSAVASAEPDLSAVASAEADETFKGTLVCAQCGLKKPDAHECQDVLLVEDGKGNTTEYYITKNDVAQKAGEACTLKIPATVTGTVSEKDGKTWLTPSKIEKH
jgi:hypothetical protein